MDTDTIKVNGSECTNVIATPVTQPVDDELLNKFSNEPLTEDPQAKKKLNTLISYLNSERFENKVNEEAYRTGIPPRQLAKGIVSKAFGIIGDILGIVVNTASCTLSGLIDLLHSILQKGVGLITRVFNGICRIVTFNQTAFNVA